MTSQTSSLLRALHEHPRQLQEARCEAIFVPFLRLKVGLDALVLQRVLAWYRSV